MPYDKPFNFADKVNRGVVASSGDVVILLNDDTQVISDDWIETLLGHLQEPDVGMVGPMLLFADGRIQSAGHYNNPTVMHLASGVRGDATGPIGILTIASERTGVTAACAALRRATYDEVGGLSLEFPNSFNDVDLAFKLLLRGLRVIWTPFAQLYHFESLSRDPAVSTEEVLRLYAALAVDDGERTVRARFRRVVDRSRRPVTDPEDETGCRRIGGTDRAAAGARERTATMIITRTPLRISIGGGGTDLPSYYERRDGGFVISAAIDKYVFISANRTFTDDYFLKYSQIERVDKIVDIAHPILREVLAMHDVQPGIEIVSTADIPAGTGLGSSGTFTVGLLKAVHALHRSPNVAHQLAEEACHVEMDLLAEPCGKQDQYIAAYGGLTCFDFRADGRVDVSALRIASDTLNELESHLLLFFTGYARRAVDDARRPAATLGCRR